MFTSRSNEEQLKLIDKLQNRPQNIKAVKTTECLENNTKTTSIGYVSEHDGECLNSEDESLDPETNDEVKKFITKSQLHPFFASMPKKALEETFEKMYNKPYQSENQSPGGKTSE